MKFGYAILYVDSVEGTIAFYEKAFGLKRDMVVEGEFGQLATGATKLGFAAIIVLAGVGIALFVAVDVIERRLIPWHASRRSDLAAGTL